MPNWSQVSGGVDRIILVALSFAVGKGWITQGDVANYSALILGILGALYSFWVNRSANLAKRAAAVPGTTVVTTPEIANAVPDAKVVSNTEHEVVAK